MMIINREDLQQGDVKACAAALLSSLPDTTTNHEALTLVQALDLVRESLMQQVIKETEDKNEAEVVITPAVPRPVFLQQGNAQAYTASLLASLPNDATFLDEETKTFLQSLEKESQTLVESVTLFRKAMQDRTRRTLHQSIQAGVKDEVAFNNNSIVLPTNVFARHILSFLSGVDLSHNVALVAKTWFAASRNKVLWHTLGGSQGLPWDSMTINNVSELLDLLESNNGQFASLRTLDQPFGSKISCFSHLERRRKACPCLENLDLDFDQNSIEAMLNKRFETTLSSFSCLRHLRISAELLVHIDLENLLETIGEGLESILVFGMGNTSWCAIRFIRSVSIYCSNLQCFVVVFYRPGGPDMASLEIKNLLDSCRKLTSLSIVGCTILDKRAFEYIVQEKQKGNMKNLVNMSINGCEELSGDPNLRRKLKKYFRCLFVNT
jgi:hypothetical protein